MENASKALIIAASILVAIALMSFMVFMFRRFGDIARNTEKKWSDQEIEAFNNKFIHYETGGNHDITTDQIGIIYYRGRAGSDPQRLSFTYKQVLKKDITNKDQYFKALVGVSQSLKKCTDVVSAINDAIDINYNNSNGYMNNYVEKQASIEIIVDLNGLQGDFAEPIRNYKYLVIEPNKNVKAKTVYGFNGTGNFTTGADNTSKRLSNIDTLSFGESNSINVYDILENMRDTEVITNDGKDHVVYKYYFLGEVYTNKSTDLVETVKFTLVEDEGFANRT